MSEATVEWRKELERELRDNILAFWMEHTIDEEGGGFYGELTEAGEGNRSADKSLVLNTRILWTFSAAFRTYGDASYRAMADRAYRVVLERFRDERNGGMYWSVDSSGAPAETKKQVYGQAFAVYALSEYYRATGDEAALREAIALFGLLERHAYDPLHGGYGEALSADWRRTDDYSLSHHGVQAAKTMNTHLHMMEAYTNLYRCWKDEALRAKLKALIDVTAERIVHPETMHFRLFMDERWNALSDHVSYGHDIEGSWLLVEAAETLGDEATLERAKATAVRMAEAVLAEGLDRDGGLWNEGDASGLVDANKDWWPQAEAIVGFYNAYELTGEAKFLEAARGSWRFIDRCLVDKERGEWYWSVTEEGVPLNRTKVNAWKCPYHNGRACLELIERLDRDREGWSRNGE